MGTRAEAIKRLSDSESVAGVCWLTCRYYYHLLSFSPVAVLVLSTMTASSIFEGDQLKPGVYKIKNAHAETFLDIEMPSREVCCRPAGSLGEGRGIVRRFSSPVVHLSEDSKWEVKRFGAGYTVQMVSLPASSNTISAI